MASRLRASRPDGFDLTALRYGLAVVEPAGASAIGGPTLKELKGAEEPQGAPSNEPPDS
jgi:hypothetical protein